MIPQYTAASIVSANKQLCTPASVDSIVSSNGQEDHVSMGSVGARKTMAIIANSAHVVAIELICACQALDLHIPLKGSVAIEALRKHYPEELDLGETKANAQVAVFLC